jgi:hypothetical protein
MCICDWDVLFFCFCKQINVPNFHKQNFDAHIRPCSKAATKKDLWQLSWKNTEILVNHLMTQSLWNFTKSIEWISYRLSPIVHSTYWATPQTTRVLASCPSSPGPHRGGIAEEAAPAGLLEHDGHRVARLVKVPAVTTIKNHTFIHFQSARSWVIKSLSNS